MYPLEVRLKNVILKIEAARWEMMQNGKNDP